MNGQTERKRLENDAISNNLSHEYPHNPHSGWRQRCADTHGRMNDVKRSLTRVWIAGHQSASSIRSTSHRMKWKTILFYFCVVVVFGSGDPRFPAITTKVKGAREMKRNTKWLRVRERNFSIWWLFILDIFLSTNMITKHNSFNLPGSVFAYEWSYSIIFSILLDQVFSSFVSVPTNFLFYLFTTSSSSFFTFCLCYTSLCLPLTRSRTTRSISKIVL